MRDKKDAKIDVQNGNFSKRDRIADLQVYELQGITYCLPINSSPKLRQYMATAILAYKEDKNFNDILKYQAIEKYEDKKWIDKNLLVSFMIAQGVDVSLNIILDFYSSLIKKKIPLNVGENSYFNTMIRLRESFKSIIILRDRGFFTEMIPIMRLIYEQLCLACYSIDETDINKLDSNWKTKNTKYLKEKINPDYGKLYSYLSAESHMANPEMGKYVDINAENMTISIKGRSYKEANEEIPSIICLYKIFLEVFKYGIKHFSDSEQAYYEELINMQFSLINMLVDINNGKLKNYSLSQKV